MDNNKITLEFTSPEAAENFIWDVRENKELNSKVKFQLSAGQKQELKNLRRAAKHPNETPLNFKAFIIVLSSGAVVWALIGLTVRHIAFFNSTVAIGILVITLAGAFATLGLPSRIPSSNRLIRLIVNCDADVVEPLRGMAQRY